MNVGFKQGKPNFTQSIVDVVFADPSLPAQFLKGQLKFLG
jgi:hypothetical protein